MDELVYPVGLFLHREVLSTVCDGYRNGDILAVDAEKIDLVCGTFFTGHYHALFHVLEETLFHEETVRDALFANDCGRGVLDLHVYNGESCVPAEEGGLFLPFEICVNHSDRPTGGRCA